MNAKLEIINLRLADIVTTSLEEEECEDDCECFDPIGGGIMNA